MSIMGMISNTKAKFRKLQTERSYRQNLARAESLQDLRQERIRLEGKAQLEKARQEEIAKIEKAKVTMKQGIGINKLANFAKGLKVTIEQRKARVRPNIVKVIGNQSAPSSPFEIKGSGLDFGGNNNKKKNNPFQL